LFTQGGAAAEPYDRVVNGFQIWSVVLAYTIAMIAVAFHVRHGTWSALTTLGANFSSLARRRLNILAYAVAGILLVGFLLPPFAILFGFVG
jgi:succinate dehydrogenase / fumarate reductase cytochrome b subunit